MPYCHDASESSPEFIACPSCRQPVKFVNNTFCKNCWTYHSKKDPAFSLPGPYQEIEPGKFTASYRWSKNKLGAQLLSFLFFSCFFAFSIIESNIAFMLVPFGLIAGYYFSVITFNRTNVYFDRETLRVTQGPLPGFFLPVKEYYRSNIKQINLKYYTHRESYGYLLYATVNDHEIDMVDLKSKTDAVNLYETLRNLWALEPAMETATENDYLESKPGRKIGMIYYFVLLSGLTLNLPSFYFTQWDFSYGFLNFNLIESIFIFSILYFHHRKYLDFKRSLPLREGMKNPGPSAYMMMTTLVLLLWIPLNMYLYTFIKSLL